MKSQAQAAEDEDNMRLRKAAAALAYYREAESMARRQLADAIDQAKRAKEKHEALFQECEARAVARRRSGAIRTENHEGG